MSRKLILLGVLSLILAPGAALSLGLGEIRLSSYLNQPLQAEIALSIGSPSELETLQVSLASGEAFARSGLDRPAFLDDLRFQVRRAGPAAALVSVTSSRPIAEPFVTFLVEARWSGGRMLREYTVLLDPPTFLPAPEAAPAPPPAVDAPRPAPVARPAPSASPVAAPTAVRSEYGAELGPVQRNDTLWNIAQRVRPDTGLTTNQVMVALFRANPNAFAGNINRLRAGAILRVPSRADMAAVSTGEASAEVRRHNEDWRTAAAPPTERRLELAPPSETPRPAPPAAAPGTPAAGSPELAEAVQQLRSELDETRRLMEVKDAEIAALQSRLADIETEGVPVATLPTAPIERPEAVDPEPAEAVEPAAPAPEPAVEPEPAVTPPPAPAPAPAPSLLDRVMGLLGNLWLWLALAAALLVTAILVYLRKRREEERSIEEDLAETGTWGKIDESGAKTAAGTAAAATITPRSVRSDDLEAILVEESAPAAAPKISREPEPLPAPVPEPDGRQDEDYQYPFEDTIAGETGINLDQTDPMAEADFHMAYGLYDQAAEIIKKAVEREPDRYDLRRKLIDICFVWGNAEEFLAQAKAVREMGGDAQAADWAKIGIMGRQICPGEPLFAVGEAASVDVDFGTEELELPEAGTDTGTSGEWLDFDVGESDEPSAALGDTREHPAPGARRPIDQTAELDLEELGIDLDLGATGEHALEDLDEGRPEDGTGDNTFAGTMRLTDPPKFGGDDEDEDGGTLVMDTSGMEQEGDDPTQRGEGLDLSEDEPTLSGVTGIMRSDLSDDTLLSESGISGDGEPEEEEPTLTGLRSASDDDDDADQTQLTRFETSDDSPTSELGTFNEDLDLDLDDLTQVLESDLEAARREDSDATQLSRRPGADGDDADATMLAPGLGSRGHGEGDATLVTPGLEPGSGSDYEEGDTREMPPVDHRAEEMNEIGTKLDLARAYMDMGDPEGARSILGEVVEEGDEAQREEARQLLDSLD
jgi:pilus assembly protein FimV